MKFPRPNRSHLKYLPICNNLANNWMWHPSTFFFIFTYLCLCHGNYFKENHPEDHFCLLSIPCSPCMRNDFQRKVITCGLLWFFRDFHCTFDFCKKSICKYCFPKKHQLKYISSKLQVNWLFLEGNKLPLWGITFCWHQQKSRAKDLRKYIVQSQQ